MRLHKLVFLSAVILSSACAAEFLPLRQGNTWTYRNAATGAQFTVAVGSPVVMGNRVYYLLRGYTQQPLFVRLNEQKDLVEINEETGVEQLLTSFEPFESGWWEAPSRACSEEGQTLQRRGVHTGVAGPIQDVLELNYRVLSCADIGTEREQYAENIGMVQRVESSIAGPQTFDLVYARVGSLQIDARLHASFTVSSIDNQQSTNLTALLRLQTNSELPLKLQFPTSQEFDVALRDEQGKVIWTWSDGQLFAAAEHQTSVSMGWELPVQVPRPESPGNYTLQAWLTTTGAGAYFAATVPVTVTK